MKTSLKRWVGKVPDLSAVMARFPVAVLVMAVFTSIWVFTDKLYNNESLGRLLVGLVIAAYLSVIITLAREGTKRSKLLIIQLITAGVLAVLFWFSKELRLNLPMAVGAVLLLLGNAVIWRRSRDDLHVWDFTHKIWTGAGFAVLGSIIFTVGVFAIGAALKSLFGLNINTLIERLLLPLGLGFLAPLYWLSTVPPVNEPYDELIDNPGFVSKAVAFLGTWLLSPLTLIYALILLAYAVKILLAGALPKGEIAQLTTPFLFIGTLTWLALEPPFIKDKAFAKLFRKSWFLISIPAALMLAIAVFVRINEYGFTEERVALFLAVIWALGLAAWFTIGPKTIRDIRIIPGFAAILLLIGTIGSGWISIGSQYNRLDNVLGQAVAKTNGKFAVIDIKSAQTAKSAINYLSNKDADSALRKAFSQIGYIPKDDINLSDIYDDLGLEDIKIPTRYDGMNQSENYEFGNKPVELAGYNQLLGPYNYYFNQTQNSKLLTLYDRDGAKLLVTNDALQLWREDVKITEVDLKTWSKDHAGASTVIKGPIIIYENGEEKLAIHPHKLNIWKDQTQEQDISGNMEFYVLLNGFNL